MKKHVLIVEDDPHIRLGLGDALRRENFEVTECPSAGPLTLTRIRPSRLATYSISVVLP